MAARSDGVENGQVRSQLSVTARFASVLASPAVLVARNGRKGSKPDISASADGQTDPSAYKVLPREGRLIFNSAQKSRQVTDLAAN